MMQGNYDRPLAAREDTVIEGERVTNVKKGDTHTRRGDSRCDEESTVGGKEPCGPQR